MTIQTRPDGLIFAESAKNGEVESFPNLLRGWGVTLDQTEGIPPMEWFNALFQRQDKSIKYLLQQGITEWTTEEEYPKDAIVKFEGKTWQAIEESKGKIPQKDSVSWKVFGVDSYSKSEADAKFARLSDFILSENGKIGIIYLPNGIVIQGFSGVAWTRMNYPIVMDFILPPIICPSYEMGQRDSTALYGYDNKSLVVASTGPSNTAIYVAFNAIVIGRMKQ